MGTWRPCGDISLEQPYYTCTRPRDHEGDHEARGWPGSKVLASWPQHWYDDMSVQDFLTPYPAGNRDVDTIGTPGNRDVGSIGTLGGGHHRDE